VRGAGGKKLRRWARELESLRSEIDGLDARVRNSRSRGLAEIRALVSRRGELELERDRETVRKKAARHTVAGLQEKIAATKQRGKKLEPVVREALGMLTAYVRNGLPYQRDARLAALSEIGEGMQKGAVDPEKAASRLWRFVEDEMGMTREVMLTKTPLVLQAGKARRLVRVVRLGMVAMFTELGDGRYGHFVKQAAGGWRHVRITDAETISQVRALFAALEKNIREGAYRLPLPPPLEREKIVSPKDGASLPDGRVTAAASALRPVPAPDAVKAEEGR
jgi:hypothetical protein